MPTTGVAGAAATKGYATRARVKADLGDLVQADSAADGLLDALILAASRALDAYCGRVFVRQALSEALDADGSVWLMLGEAPVVQVTSVLFDSSPITDYTVDDPDAGILYRRVGWDRSTGSGWFLGELRAPGAEERRYQVEYVAGYLTPADNLASRTVSCAAVDQAYHDSAAGFPLLVPGDQVLASGFTTPSNNGWKTVVTRTTSVLVVTGEPLVDEAAPLAAGGARELRVQTLPDDVQQACVETVKAFYLARTRDPNVSSRRIGDLAITYGAPAGLAGGQEAEALPFRAIGLLKAYTRAA